MINQMNQQDYTLNPVIKAIVFDLDGLLVDTERLFFSAMKKSLKEFGINLKKIEYINMDLQNGTSVLEHFQSIGKISSIKNVQKKIYHNYFHLLKSDLKPIPGAPEAVRRLSDKFTLGIASSSKKLYIKYILKHLKLGKYFQEIVSRESTNNLKPDPECLLLLLKKFNLQPKECVLIEDSLRGLKAAKAIGMPCIIIPNIYTKNFTYSDADVVLSSIRLLEPKLIHNISMKV